MNPEMRPIVGHLKSDTPSIQNIPKYRGAKTGRFQSKVPNVSNMPYASSPEWAKVGWSPNTEDGRPHPIHIGGVGMTNEQFDDLVQRGANEQRSEHVRRIAKAFQTGCATDRRVDEEYYEQI